MGNAELVLHTWIAGHCCAKMIGSMPPTTLQQKCGAQFYHAVPHQEAATQNPTSGSDGLDTLEDSAAYSDLNR